MPPAVERIARSYLRNPAYVYIGDQSSSRDNIKQDIVFLKENQKKEKLMHLLTDGPPPPIIVWPSGWMGTSICAATITI